MGQLREDNPNYEIAIFQPPNCARMTFSVCIRCGVPAWDIDRHDEWHTKNDKPNTIGGFKVYESAKGQSNVTQSP